MQSARSGGLRSLRSVFPLITRDLSLARSKRSCISSGLCSESGFDLAAPLKALPGIGYGTPEAIRFAFGGTGLLMEFIEYGIEHDLRPHSEQFYDGLGIAIWVSSRYVGIDVKRHAFRALVSEDFHEAIFNRLDEEGVKVPLCFAHALTSDTSLREVR